MDLLNKIKEDSAKAWNYFMDFYLNEFEGKLNDPPFEKLAFEFQLGVFIHFFDKINSDIQLYSTDIEILKESILEAFATYEEYLFLDS